MSFVVSRRRMPPDAFTAHRKRRNGPAVRPTPSARTARPAPVAGPARRKRRSTLAGRQGRRHHLAQLHRSAARTPSSSRPAVRRIAGSSSWLTRSAPNRRACRRVRTAARWPSTRRSDGGAHRCSSGGAESATANSLGWVWFVDWLVRLAGRTGTGRVPTRLPFFAPSVGAFADGGCIRWSAIGGTSVASSICANAACVCGTGLVLRTAA